MEIIKVRHFLAHVKDIETAISLSLVCKEYRKEAVSSITINLLCSSLGIVYQCPTFITVIEVYDRTHYGPRSHLHMHPTRLMRMAAINGCLRGIALAQKQKVVFTIHDLREAARHGQVEVVNVFVRSRTGGYREAALGYSIAISNHPHVRNPLVKILTKYSDLESAHYKAIAQNLIVANQVDILMLLVIKDKIKSTFIFSRACEAGKYEVARAFSALVNNKDKEEIHRMMLNMKKLVARVEETEGGDNQYFLNTLRTRMERAGLTKHGEYLRSKGARLSVDAFDFAFTRADDRLARELLQQYRDKGAVAQLLNEHNVVPHVNHLQLLIDHGEIVIDACVRKLSTENIIAHAELVEKWVGKNNMAIARFDYAVSRGWEQEVRDTQVSTLRIHKAIVSAAKKNMRSMVKVLLSKLREEDRSDIIDKIGAGDDGTGVVIMDKDIKKLFERQ